MHKFLVVQPAKLIGHPIRKHINKVSFRKLNFNIFKNFTFSNLSANGITTTFKTKLFSILIHNKRPHSRSKLGLKSLRINFADNNIHPIIRLLPINILS